MQSARQPKDDSSARVLDLIVLELRQIALAQLCLRGELRLADAKLVPQSPDLLSQRHPHASLGQRLRDTNGGRSKDDEQEGRENK